MFVLTLKMWEKYLAGKQNVEGLFCKDGVDTYNFKPRMLTIHQADVSFNGTHLDWLRLVFLFLHSLLLKRKVRDFGTLTVSMSTGHF